MLNRRRLYESRKETVVRRKSRVEWRIWSESLLQGSKSIRLKLNIWSVRPCMNSNTRHTNWGPDQYPANCTYQSHFLKQSRVVRPHSGLQEDSHWGQHNPLQPILFHLGHFGSTPLRISCPNKSAAPPIALSKWIGVASRQSKIRQYHHCGCFQMRWRCRRSRWIFSSRDSYPKRLEAQECFSSDPSIVQGQVELEVQLCISFSVSQNLYVKNSMVMLFNQIRCSVNHWW
jgi:hypothetical protein